MPSITIAELRAAGLSDKQIVDVLNVSEQERVARRREQNRINKRNQRMRQQFVADGADSADIDDPSSFPSLKEKSPHTPLKENNPSYPSPASLRSAARARATVWPDDFTLSEADLRVARAEGMTDSKIASELAHFHDHAIAKGCRYVDWHAAWRNWTRSPYQKPNGNGGTYHAANPTGKTCSDVAREMLAKISRDEGGDFGGLLPEKRGE